MKYVFLNTCIHLLRKFLLYLPTVIIPSLSNSSEKKKNPLVKTHLHISSQFFHKPREEKKLIKKGSFPDNSLFPGTHITVNILDSTTEESAPLSLFPRPYNQRTSHCIDVASTVSSMDSKTHP